jgi:iron complex outermembrane receptor protein
MSVKPHTSEWMTAVGRLATASHTVRLAAAVTLWLALGAAGATADDATQASVTNSSLSDLTLEQLVNVEVKVYAASRHEQPVSEAPAAVTIITRDDIQKYGYRTLAQALASVPGFYMSDDRAYESVGVRGIGLPSDYNVRLLFLLNGLPLNDKYFDQFVIELTPDMLDAVDRIEVVKGPSSALYGSDALFATVNIITRTGKDVNGALVSAEGGSSPLGRGVVTYGQQFTNGLDLFFSGHYEDNEGDRFLSFGSFGKAHDADDERLADVYLSAKYQDFSAQLWYADRRKEIPTGQFGTIVGDPRNFTADTYYLAELRWQRALDDDKTLMLRAYFEDYPYHGQYVYDDPEFTLNQEQTLDRWLGYEAQFNWQPFEKHRLTFGGVYEYHWTDLSGCYWDSTGSVSFVYPGTHNDFSYYAFYAQDEIALLPQLKLTAGGRYDAYLYDNVSRLTPRAALVWQATKATTVKLLYGEAFRAPSEYQLTYSAGSGTGPANPNLKPESISTYELVLEQDFQQGLFGHLSVFHNDAQDLVANPAENLTSTVFTNAYNVHTTGVEAELSKRFASGLRGFANGMWQTSDFSTGSAINSPEWIGNLGVAIPICGDKLCLAARENFVSDRAGKAPGIESEDAFRTDLTLRSDNALRNWAFLLEVQNLFDQRNTVPAGGDGTLNVIPQPGRLVVLRATHKI